jgi:hypothetical protein
MQNYFYTDDIFQDYYSYEVTNFRDSEYVRAEEVLQDTAYKLIKCSRL